MIMKGLGKVEDEIFKRRQQDEERFRENQKAKKARQQQFGFGRGGRGRGRGRGAPAYIPNQGILAPMSAPRHHSGQSTRQMASDARQTAMQFNDDANAQAAANLKMLLNVKGEESPAEKDSRKRKADQPLIREF
uniref:Uncharacterized protein n=1 Tax=Caenorhabditis japonica TaxID=281687 RepID=A0A8R1DJ61_CAEJA